MLNPVPHYSKEYHLAPQRYNRYFLFQNLEAIILFVLITMHVVPRFNIASSLFSPNYIIPSCIFHNVPGTLLHAWYVIARMLRGNASHLVRAMRHCMNQQ